MRNLTGVSKISGSDGRKEVYLRINCYRVLVYNGFAAVWMSA